MDREQRGSGQSVLRGESDASAVEAKARNRRCNSVSDRERAAVFRCLAAAGERVARGGGSGAGAAEGGITFTLTEFAGMPSARAVAMRCVCARRRRAAQAGEGARKTSLPCRRSARRTWSRRGTGRVWRSRRSSSSRRRALFARSVNGLLSRRSRGPRGGDDGGEDACMEPNPKTDIAHANHTRITLQEDTENL